MIVSSPYPEIEIDDVPVHEYVLRRAAGLGDKAALIDGPSGRTLSYAQLAHAVERMAAGLAERGFQKGDVFAIYSPNLPEYAIAFHGVSRAGGVNTTVNPLFTVDELVKQLRDAKAKFLLTVPPFLPNALAAAEQCDVQEVFVLGEGEGATPFVDLLNNAAPAPDVAFKPHEDLIALPYSSGTTAFPKGVMLTHRNLVANVMQIEANGGNQLITPEDMILGVLPFFHIYGMTVIMNYALARGATIVTMPRFDMEQFLDLIQQHRITRTYLVPPIVLGLAKHPLVDAYDLSSLKFITCGAAPLSDDLARAAATRLNCIVHQGYGLTETSPVTHMCPDDVSWEKPGSIGPCLSSTEALVVDVGTHEPVGIDEPGEIWIRGPQVMLGYLNEPQETALAIDSEGWFHTGDVGYVDGDGHFYIVDRVKELIKYKGFQVAPAELEALLLQRSDIMDAAVIGRPDEEAGEVPKAFVVTQGEVQAVEIMSWVAERVAPHKRIRQIEFVDQIPKSLSGKILRRLLVEKERAGQ